MGLAARDRLWPVDTTLQIRFIGGSDRLQQRVFDAGKSWLLDGVRLRMQPANEGEVGDIRVSFDERDGSWSYIGTGARDVRPNQATMNLGWVAEDTPEEDFCSVVIHEFGHALGLLHEHNHPLARINWNKPAVYADLGGPPNNWSKAQIDANVFAQFDESQVIITDFDQASVMIYPILSSWTMDGQSFTPSWKLSPGDEETIQRLYA